MYPIVQSVPLSSKAVHVCVAMASGIYVGLHHFILHCSDFNKCYLCVSITILISLRLTTYRPIVTIIIITMVIMTFGHKLRIKVFKKTLMQHSSDNSLIALHGGMCMLCDDILIGLLAVVVGRRPLPLELRHGHA